MSCCAASLACCGLRARHVQWLPCSRCRTQALMAQIVAQAVSDWGVLWLPGIELLQQIGDVDKAYNLTPEQLQEKIASADALIIRSATQASSAA